MKFQLVLVSLGALVWSSTARGLKGAAQPRSVQLQAENDALTKKNKHLEAMMQLARAEVHRMDAVRKHGGGSNVDVLTQEVEDLKGKLASMTADKKSLVQTLRQLLSRNSTKIFQTQADKAQKSQRALEIKCVQAHQSCEAQVKEANGKHDEAKEMAQTLQEQNMDLQRTVQDLRAKLAAASHTDDSLKDDKANLVNTMHSLMRENGAVKKELHAEEDTVKKEAQEITLDEAKLAKLSKKPKAKAVAAKKQTRKAAVKNGPLRLNHEESMASKIAKLDHINRYIDRQYSSDDSDESSLQAAEGASVTAAAPKVLEDDWQTLTKQVGVFQTRLADTDKDVVAKQEDVIAKNRALSKAADSPQAVADAAVLADRAGSAGLSDWLGLPKAKPVAIPKDVNGMSPIDALDPDAVKQEKAAEAQKAKTDADDGGDGVADLLAQAKDQLSAMDRAEAQNA